ncbi:MAG: nucleotidyltransferase, partial [Polaromonas sp.]|nr:nucleotidyltransferase [Polaromonas sp.]MDO8373331.1 nucleotidyltransferase [Polaromonas sp.]
MTDAEQPLSLLNADLSPSSSLLANLRQELMRHPPFAQMQAGDVDFFLKHARQNYFAPEEILIEPDSGPVTELFFIRQGAVI